MRWKLICLAGLCLSIAQVSRAELTPVWKQFVEAKKNGTEPTLPDFSYAGYHDGEKAIPDVKGPIFDVTKYGAIPNDDKSDEPAIRAAISEAEAKGGGVVFIPKGNYLLSTETDPIKPIEIHNGNIVIRGEGLGKDGTVLRFVKNQELTDPTKMYSTPFYFEITSKGETKKGKELAKVTGAAERETFSVKVDDASKLKPGMRVTLYVQSKELAKETLAPKEIDPLWTRIAEDGLLITERHRIASIKDNTITFVEPLHTNVNPAYGWTLRPYETIEEIGIEDICFYGGFVKDFVHHRSGYDDGAWSMIYMEGVSNSWIRRCSFIDCNNVIELHSDSQITVLGVIIDGNPGHFGMHARAGYGVFGGLLEYRAWMWHGPSVGYQGVGTVYWRCTMLPEERMDSHSGQPYATLHDNTKGGILVGAGGPIPGLPHHLRYWTLWNFEYQGKEKFDYDLWSPTRREKFLMPIVVGYHGTPSTFAESNFQLIESNGKAVEPESLYEAQIALRLAKEPAWLTAAREQWKTLRETPLPEWTKAPPLPEPSHAPSQD